MRLLVFTSLVVAVSVMTLSCSRAPENPKSESAVMPNSHEPPKDNASKFPSEGQTAMQLIPDHLLGKDFMPGGNLATYKTDDGNFQMFLMEAPDPSKAAYMLLDWKDAMPDAKYLAHMGGYFGNDKGKPTYIFSKGTYLVGLVGLPESKADTQARIFAARL